MKKCKFICQVNIYAQNVDYSFCLECEQGLSIHNELLKIFYQINNNTVSIPFVMTQDIKNSYTDFVNKYKYIPQFNKLKFILDKIECGKYFLVTFNNNSTKERMLINNLLYAMNICSDDQDRMQLFNCLCINFEKSFGDLFDEYELRYFDSTQRISVNNSDIRNKKCRFCGKGKNETTFNNSHAISKALGNTNLKCFEECKQCNTLFGNTIEQDLIKYLQPYIAHYGIKGRHGYGKYNYQNGACMFFYDKNKENIDNKKILEEISVTIGKTIDNLSITISPNIKFNQQDKTLKCTLEGLDKITPANIYKCLCKFAISLMDKNELPNLQQTIKWILSQDTKEYKPLPLIAMSFVPFKKDTALMIYIRQSQNGSLPHIFCEFIIGYIRFIYILPFSIKDNIDFSKKEYFDEFIDFLNNKKYFAGINKTEDFSSNKAMKYCFNIVCHQK